MVIWIIIAALCLFTSAILYGGARAQGLRGSTSARDAQLAIYKDQLAELAADEARGVLAASEAEQQRTEVARRILAASREQEVAPDDARDKSGVRLALLTALIVPALALVIYSQVGAPALPDLPQAQRLASAEKNSDLDAMVYKVEQHLAKNPNDASGWEILLPSYQSMGRFGDAAEALRRIMAIKGATADRQADLAEMLMFKGQGLMPADGVEAARAALALDPKNSKARYFYALSLEQDGKRPEALTLLQQLLADTPADAPWRASVEKQIAHLKTAPAAAPQPTPEQVAAAQAMPAADQQDMIRGMVNGLAEKLKANPQDLQGWLRLIRARIVLKEADSARAALDTARQTFAADQGALDQLSALAQELEAELKLE